MAKRADDLWDDEFERCVAFHGHACPGLAIGYRAAKAGMGWLGERRAADEEIVAVVETDACGDDAIQVLTGCTFGKGNLIFRDYGKHAYTFLSRSSGRGVRLLLRAGGPPRTSAQAALFERVRAGEATDEDLLQYGKDQKGRIQEVLTRPLEQLFVLQEVHMALPPRAILGDSRPCDRCGEMTMSLKMVERAGLLLCRGCLAAEG